jgi:putative sterol carrier protein
MTDESNQTEGAGDFVSKIEGFITNAYNASGDKLRTHLAGTILITLKDSGKKLSFDGRTGKFGAADTSDCQISTTSRYLEEISTGDLNPQIAMLTEKIGVSGDVSLAVYFFNLICPDSNN